MFINSLTGNNLDMVAWATMHGASDPNPNNGMWVRDYGSYGVFVTREPDGFVATVMHANYADIAVRIVFVAVPETLEFRRITQESAKAIENLGVTRDQAQT
ncbi:hypothetical protein [Plectonema phage Pbo-yong3]|uniref:hypothetical protein n=1 Tax=Plectonema phage Pbo-yong3 TaxID=2970324 RepID=UPI00403C7B2E|nr:hypothetical protein [Plectonema phage Pbo-yong3]